MEMDITNCIPIVICPENADTDYGTLAVINGVHQSAYASDANPENGISINYQSGDNIGLSNPVFEAISVVPTTNSNDSYLSSNAFAEAKANAGGGCDDGAALRVNQLPDEIVDVKQELVDTNSDPYANCHAEMQFKNTIIAPYSDSSSPKTTHTRTANGHGEFTNNKHKRADLKALVNAENLWLPPMTNTEPMTGRVMKNNVGLGKITTEKIPNTRKPFYLSKMQKKIPYTHTPFNLSKMQKNTPKYKCPICLRFSSEDTKGMLDHLRGTHSMNTDFACLLCSQKGKELDYPLTVHERKAHREQDCKFKCSICKKILKTQTKFYQHLSKHLLPCVKMKRVEIEVPLSQRNAAYPMGKNMQESTRKRENDHLLHGDHICRFCGRLHKTLFSNDRHEHWHLRCIEAQEYHICSVCDQLYSKNIYDIDMHLEKFHMLSVSNICSICHRVLNSSLDEKVHAKIHTCRYQCENCGLMFNMLENYMLHVYTHNVPTRFQCLSSDCGAYFQSRYALCRHTAMHFKPNDVHSCLVCGKAGLSEKDINSHMRLHSDLKLVYCAECTQVFLNQTDYNSHECEVTFQGESDSSEDLECGTCEHIFNSKKNFLKHSCMRKRKRTKRKFEDKDISPIKASKKAERYDCPECLTDCYTEHKLLRHMAKSSCFINQEINKSIVMVRFACTTCKQTFKEDSDFLGHECSLPGVASSVGEATHHFRCPECSEVFQNKQDFVTHKRSCKHLFVCSVCGRSAPSKELFLSHVRHTCTQRVNCLKRFASKPVKVCTVCGAEYRFLHQCKV